MAVEHTFLTFSAVYDLPKQNEEIPMNAHVKAQVSDSEAKWHEHLQATSDALCMFHVQGAIRAIRCLVDDNQEEITVRGEDMGSLMAALLKLADGAKRHAERLEDELGELRKRHA